MTKFIKENLEIKGETFQLFSQYYENDNIIHRNFMVSQGGNPVLIYDLGITRIALIIYNENEFKASEWLYDLGKKFIPEMIAENISQKSGIITSHEMSKGFYDWRQLEPLDLDKDYNS